MGGAQIPQNADRWLYGASREWVKKPAPDDLPGVFPIPAIVIAAVALAALSPMLFLGIPSGHDLEFHVNSWMEVVNQWHSGVVYPRWAASAHYGFGEARFIFYPPGSWLLGALLGLILPWAIVPAAYMWMALTAAGLAMHLLARRFLPVHASIFAGALYALNPYHLVIVYWRSAYAELLAAFLFPLLLLFVLRIEEEGKRMIVPLALVVAAGWLANAPAGVMVNYSLALMVVVVAIVRRSPRILFYAVMAVTLGAALAGFYLLPVAHEQQWVNLGEVFSSGVRPQDNFLFTQMPDVDHNRFNLLVSVVAVGEMALLCGFVFVSRAWRKRQRELWWLAVSWATAAALLMLSPTLVFWEHLPKLRFVQLPWRWLLCLNVPLALLTALALSRWRTRLVVSAATIAVLMFMCIKIQPPWWDTGEDISELRDNIVEGKGYEGTDEYVPVGIDAYEIKEGSPEVRVDGGGPEQVRILQWGPELKIFSTESNQAEKLRIRLFHYPAWKIEVNGRPVEEQADETTGQVMVPVAAGRSLVRIRFGRTWDRTAGALLSLIAWLGLAGLVILFRRPVPEA